VDGAKNPELIPDLTAYRLWLVTVSVAPDAGEKEKAFQQAHLEKLGLIQQTDYSQLLTVLTEFKAQYASLIARYNESAKADLLNGITTDQTLFLQQRDDLVMNTRAAITQRLSLRGSLRIDAHVQHEKSRIRIHTTGGVRP